MASESASVSVQPAPRKTDCEQFHGECKRAVELIRKELAAHGVASSYLPKPKDYFVRGPGAHSSRSLSLSSAKRICSHAICSWQFQVGDAAVDAHVNLDNSHTRIDPHDWDGEPLLTIAAWLQHRRAKEAMQQRIGRLGAVRRHCKQVTARGYRCIHWVEQMPKPGCRPSDADCEWRAYVGGLTEVASSRHFTVIVTKAGSVKIDDGAGNVVSHARWLAQPR